MNDKLELTLANESIMIVQDGKKNKLGEIKTKEYNLEGVDNKVIINEFYDNKNKLICKKVGNIWEATDGVYHHSSLDTYLIPKELILEESKQ
ncbi:MAG: hypothetical protein NTZ83_04815 [Candidatus Pacearchaeota archaeon]|nr:hypothetical protein [Candidatus Pacearchaeota archaeon]